MIKYVNKVLMGFPEEIGRPEASTEYDWLFQVRKEEGYKPRPEEQAQEFHRVDSQLLFLSNST